MAEEPPSIASYRDLTKQLLTLASAILTLTLTFLKDVVGTTSIKDQPFLVASWLLYLISILAGLGALMGAAGALFCLENPKAKGCEKSQTIYSPAVRNPSWIQVVAFFLATTSLVIAGTITLGSDEPTVPSTPPGIPSQTTVGAATLPPPTT